MISSYFGASIRSSIFFKGNILWDKQLRVVCLTRSKMYYADWTKNLRNWGLLHEREDSTEHCCVLWGISHFSIYSYTHQLWCCKNRQLRFFCCIRLRVFDRTKSRNHFQLRLLLKGKGAQILVWVMNLKMRNNCFVILSCPTKAKFIASLIWHTHIRYTEKLNLVNSTYQTTRDLAQFPHTPTFWDGSHMQNLELVISYQEVR